VVLDSEQAGRLTGFNRCRPGFVIDESHLPDRCHWAHFGESCAISTDDLEPTLTRGTRKGTVTQTPF
jgi:hypothetical protein